VNVGDDREKRGEKVHTGGGAKAVENRDFYPSCTHSPWSKSAKFGVRDYIHCTVIL